jgi:FKBP-type peptidyl-prolyl cis-trans isomerase
MAREFKNDTEKFSYALAMNMSAHLLKMPIELDREIIIEAVTALLRGNQPDMSQEDYQQTMQKFQATMEEKANAEAQKAASENSEKGKAYLAENAKKEGVKVTASGLQYEVIKEGTGKKPAATDTVSVHYEGTLINGQVFDSSIRRGQPVEFPLNRVIPGWTEGVQLMSVGSKYRFVIPSNLAYGEHGAGGAIGPNETLIFEVELLDIK